MDADMSEPRATRVVDLVGGRVQRTERASRYLTVAYLEDGRFLELWDMPRWHCASAFDPRPVAETLPSGP